MLGQRRRRWYNITTTLGLRPLFAGYMIHPANATLKSSTFNDFFWKSSNISFKTQKY